MATTRHLSSADVAKELGCNTRQVSRLVAAGTLTPAVQAPGLRGAFLFDPTEVARVKRLRAWNAWRKGQQLTSIPAESRTGGASIPVPR